MRTWKPIRPISVVKWAWPISVVKWTWEKRTGLIVHYSDGLVVRSAWGTLREFLAAIRDGRERASESP